MWHTENGDRTLKDLEASLFADALGDLLEDTHLDENNDYELGINIFDNLTYPQKISVLSTIGNGLLRQDIPSVKLSAVLEGAIAAVFQHIKISIIIEIDEPRLKISWRKKVVAARKEAGGEEIPSLDCEDMEEWDIEVESLADDILWDNDYDSEDIFIDQSPEKSRGLKQLAGIANDYYLGVAEDLSEEEVGIKLREIRQLCREIVGEE